MVVLQRDAGNLWVARFSVLGARRTLAAIHGIGATALVLVVVMQATVLAMGAADPGLMAILIAVTALLGGLLGAAWWGIRNDLAWQRPVSITASVLVTPIMPVGTLAGVYGILLLRRALSEPVP